MVSPDSLEAHMEAAVEEWQREGYFFAAFDSVVIDSSNVPVRVTGFLNPGPAAPIGRIDWQGNELLDDDALNRASGLAPGVVLTSERLQEGIDGALTAYDAAGRGLARVRVEHIDYRAEPTPHLEMVLGVSEGAPLILSEVRLSGSERTREGFLARLLGLEKGAPLASYDPETLRRRLNDSGLFQEVSEPELIIRADSSAVIRFDVKEGPPGAFDLVFGYLPSSGQGKGSLIGSGHIEVNNLFGTGKILSARLNRLPGQVSRVEARYADLFVLGTPFFLTLEFQGLQQDSTFGKQRLGGELGRRLAGALQGYVAFSRETTRPAKTGRELATGASEQRIARSDATFGGLGLRYQRLDRAVNPRRGLYGDVHFERGSALRSARRIDSVGDTLLTRDRLYVDRLRLTGRLYRPLFNRQVLAAGIDMALLAGEGFDESDLFRFGGAATLRGYDEERFRGRAVSRALIEYRLLIDDDSFAFGFFDLGYVDQPGLPGIPSARGFYPGYGIGVQFDTPVGLVNAGYAINPETGPTSGRVHVGLSFGL